MRVHGRFSQRRLHIAHNIMQLYSTLGIRYDFATLIYVACDEATELK